MSKRLTAEDIARGLPKAQRRGQGWRACCPAHDDYDPSLDIDESDDGTLLVTCRAGCEQRDVIEALKRQGLWNGKATNGKANGHDQSAWRIVEIYQYTPDLRVVRKERPSQTGGKPHKTFSQQHRTDAGWKPGTNGAKFPPYRLNDLQAAIGEGVTVFIVEGERKVDRLRAKDVPATCNVGGAKKWRKEWNEHFRGADIVILPDNDVPGRKHAEQVAAILQPVAKQVRFLDLPGLPPKGDVVDWLDAGGTAEQLYQVLQEAGREWFAEGAEANADWRAQLVLNSRGTRQANEANFAIEPHHDEVWQDVFNYDAFSQEIVLREPIPQRSGAVRDDNLPRSWTDGDAADVLQHFQLGDYPHATLARVETAIHLEASKYRRVHPVKDYLSALRWDGVPRIYGWLKKYCQAKIEVDDASEWARAVGSKWLISAVARVYRPGCQADHVLVLEGEQGCGSTSALRILGDPWFSESLTGDLHSKDAANHVRGKWIIELAELSQFRRSDVETLKSFISRQQERFRPAYGRKEVVYPRQCVFAGTTNSSQYLTDATGGRRFWPVKVGTIDLDALRRDCDQLWAEAVHRYMSGESWWLDEQRLQATARAQQADRYLADPWEARVLAHIAGLTETTILDILERGVFVTSSRQEMGVQKRVAAILQQNGWESRRTMHGRKWVKRVK